MSYIVQDAESFWSDFVACVGHAGNAISIRVMEFEVGPKTERLVTLLKQKMSEGVTVSIFVDWVYSRYVHGDISLLPVLSKEKRRHNTAIHADTLAMLDDLRDAGAQVQITNIPNSIQALLPIAGRNHTKIYIVDNAAWIGGVHPVESAFNNIDCMVKTCSPKLVSAIKTYVANSKDEMIQIDADTRLLYDGGKIGSSIIYKEALDSLEAAWKEIIFMSQFIPDGALLNKLVAKARQGVRVTVITSPKVKSALTDFPANLTYTKNMSKATKQPNIQFIHCGRGVHAKLLVIDRRKVLFGSHNFVSAGVWLGTQEICLVSKEDALTKDFIGYIAKSIPKGSKKHLRL